VTEPALGRVVRCPGCEGLFRARRRSDPTAPASRPTVEPRPGGAPASCVPSPEAGSAVEAGPGDSLTAESHSSWAGGTVVLDETGVAELLAEISRRQVKPIEAKNWKPPPGDAPAAFAVKLVFADVPAAKRSLDALLPSIRSKARKIISPCLHEGRCVAILELGLRLPVRQAVEALRGVIAAGGRLLGVNTDDSFDAERLLLLLADPTATDPAALVDPGLSDSGDRPVGA
jgi:hypothetical protein